jgi:hypothetical protein
VVAAWFALCAGTTGAAAPGPYYAPPSWDQQLAVSTRFIVLSNWVDSNFPAGGAAVLDRETGLVWERSPSTFTFIWSDALGLCMGSRTGKRMGWRLPTEPELSSLIDLDAGSPPFLPPGHPFMNVQSSAYWSATSLGTGSAYGQHFDRLIIELFSKDTKLYFWCVRGGRGTDPQ